MQFRVQATHLQPSFDDVRDAVLVPELDRLGALGGGVQVHPPHMRLGQDVQVLARFAGAVDEGHVGADPLALVSGGLLPAVSVLLATVEVHLSDAGFLLKVRETQLNKHPKTACAMCMFKF